jgi:hypothetical protein
MADAGRAAGISRADAAIDEATTTTDRRLMFRRNPSITWFLPI